jgi:hypothetical protein
MNSESPRRRDWFTPLIVFIPAASIAAMSGGQAETLRLPTAWFAQTSHLWMLALIVVSFVISSPRVSMTVWLLGFGCVAYAPLLVTFGSSLIPLSRTLSHEESEAFRHRFPVPVLLYSASGEGDCLRVRRQDFSDAMRTHIQTIGALREPGTSH